MSIDPVKEMHEGAKAMHEAAAEIRRLRAECKRHADNHDQVVGWLREKQAENERLRKAIEEALSTWGLDAMIKLEEALHQ